MSDYPLRSALVKAMRYLETKGIDTITWKGMIWSQGTKTVEYFVRVLSGMVRDLYRDEVSESDFVGEMADLIQQQLTRAWNEGMRANGLDPQEDMEPEWETMRDDIIAKEYDYVDQFAADIVTAREQQAGWDQLQSRAQLWANRYTDVVNQAIVATKEQKLKWVYGDTDHCNTCERLNGIIAFSSEWDLAGVKPQSPPNDVLECGGWRCQCALEPTTERKTRNAFDAIMRALGK